MWLTVFSAPCLHSTSSNISAAATGNISTSSSSAAAAATETDNGSNHSLEGMTALYLLFDESVTIACVRLWNYAKTPARGVNEFDVCTTAVFLADALLLL